MKVPVAREEPGHVGGIPYEDFALLIAHPTCPTYWSSSKADL